MPRRWFLDFDDTLASGPTTWGLKYAFPKLVRDNHLPMNEAVFSRAILAAQEQSNRDFDPRPILNKLFAEMNWPDNLQSQLLQDIQMNYRPELFNDVIPFLGRLREDKIDVFILSNNPHTPEYVQALGIGKYIVEVFTPKTCPGSQPKPHHSLWNYIVESHPGITNNTSAMLGDDPWSDGEFAEKCGLACWIVDRDSRFTSMYGDKPYHWVQSLFDILVMSS